jgi:hypothetical protein
MLRLLPETLGGRGQSPCDTAAVFDGGGQAAQECADSGSVLGKGDPPIGNLDHAPPVRQGP